MVYFVPNRSELEDVELELVMENNDWAVSVVLEGVAELMTIVR
jgi:hypothetical protein